MTSILHKFYKIGSMPFFYKWAHRALPYLGWGTLVLFVIGLYWSLVMAPSDYQQGDAFRIIYIHVPCALLALSIYVFMGSCAISSLIWKVKLSDILLKQASLIGFCYTLIALVTGSLWGKPMWGTWWIWDARLTSMLVLLFLYMANLALYNAIPNKTSASKIIAIVTLVGLVDIPIIHYSVYWFNTLHQGATISMLAKPKMALDMLWPLIIMNLAFVGFFMHTLLKRALSDILKAQAKTKWVQEIFQKDSSI